MSGMTPLDFVFEQFKTLPVLFDGDTCTGKTYIVTGANHGIGLETTRHLVRASAARVILAVRNLAAGEQAKTEIERSTNRKGVMEVWTLDLASFDSVRAFAAKASAELARIDAVIENAGVLLDAWTLSEGTETVMTVNVLSTFLLGVLMMPKLVESAAKFDIKPRLIFITSALGFTMKKELEKGGKTDIFNGLNNPKTAAMDDRYSLTKLVQMFLVRELAAICQPDETGVIVNMVAPGLCSTGLARDGRTWTRAWIAAIRAIMARSAEQGSRTILHGILAEEDSHGTYLSGCKIREDWIPGWMTDVEGQKTQKQLWKEFTAMMEAIQPGCISRLVRL